MAVSEFRRSTKNETKKAGGKGGRGNWREQYKLPKVQATPFILIKGDYLDPDPDPDNVEIDLSTGQPLPVKVPYHKWLNHVVKTVWQGTGKPRYINEPCARGWDKHNPQSCAGCAAIDTGDKRINLTEKYSFGIIHLALYHRHPLADYKNPGQWVNKKDNSGPVLVETECTGIKQCNFCRWMSGQPPILQQGENWPQYPQGSISTVFGSRRYLELGKGHLADLGEWDKQISSRCGGIAYVRNPDGSFMLNQQGQAIPKGRCNAFLDVDGYACPHCNQMLINAETDPRPLEELEALTMKKYPCHHCQRPVFLKEINSCSSCGNGSVQGLFDGVLYGQRQGEDTQSHLVLVQFDTLADFEASLPPDVRQLIGKPLSERIAELNKPYEFSELYKPKSYEEMAKRLELNVQTQSVYGQQPQYQQYAQPQGFAPPPQQMYGAQPAMPQQQPQYQPYATPTGPGPIPFVPPTKPNFGQ